MSSYSSTPNFDNLLLQTLMGRLQIRPSNPFPNHQTLDHLLFDSNAFSDDEQQNANNLNKTPLAKEESKLEKEIIRTILNGKSESLKPNSGQAVTVGEHHICVGFHEDSGSDYRVWEWHGHIMLFDEENGYTPEYIYGNYFERVLAKPVVVPEEKVDDDEEEEEEEKNLSNLGLKELIESVELSGARVLHRNINAGSPRS